jgi:aspartate/methionine/tyrosine aminotransferase
VLCIYSLSKQSNLAGYRAALAAGDPNLIAGIVNLRMHSGMITPLPVQRVMKVALSDFKHVQQQRELYRARRAELRAALVAAGYQISSSEAGLYLWATRGKNCWTEISELSELGILAVPGEFYGDAGAKHVRFSITATDEQIASASRRLADALG